MKTNYKTMTGRRPTQKEYQDLLEREDYFFNIEDVTIYPNGKIHIEMPKEMDSLVNQILGLI